MSDLSLKLVWPWPYQSRQLEESGHLAWPYHAVIKYIPERTTDYEKH